MLFVFPWALSKCELRELGKPSLVSNSASNLRYIDDIIYDFEQALKASESAVEEVLEKVKLSN
jgi:hypothetical protein